MKIRNVSATMLLVALFIYGCEKSESPKRDILMEVAQNLEDVFNTPTVAGKRIYSRYCSVCHGPSGKGDGFNAFNLKPKPRNFIDSTFRARLDTTMIAEVITNGGKAAGLSSLMPPWGNTLSEADIKLVANYILYLISKSEIKE